MSQRDGRTRVELTPEQGCSKTRIRYFLYVFLGAWLLSFLYAWYAFRGHFFSAALIAIGYLIWLAFGAALKPNNKTPLNLPVAGVTGALFIFFYGHLTAYYAQVEDIATAARAEDSLGQYTAKSDQEIYNAHLQRYLNDSNATGFSGYFSFLKTYGFDENGPRRHGNKLEHSSGNWVTLSWIWQLIMFMGGRIHRMASHRRTQTKRTLESKAKRSANTQHQPTGKP